MGDDDRQYKPGFTGLLKRTYDRTMGRQREVQNGFTNCMTIAAHLLDFQIPFRDSIK